MGEAGFYAGGRGTSFWPLHTLSRPDSKLRGELQALRETFSNFTATTEVEVKALSSQGEGAGAGAGGRAVGR